MNTKQLLTVEQALYHATRDYPGGGTAIAAIYGWNAQVLNNCLNLHQKSHRPNVGHLVGILETTCDQRILDAIGHVGGGIFVPVDPLGNMPSDDQLLDDVLAMINNVSSYGKVVRDSLEDNRVTNSEWYDLQKAALECLKSVHVLLSRCESQRNPE